MTEQPKQEQRPFRSAVGVWMESSGNSQSIARAIAVDAMRALGLDFENDFGTRDKIIAAIVDRVDRTLDEVAALNKALTPKQVELARWLLDNVDVDVYEEISWIRISYKLLREVVGDE